MSKTSQFNVARMQSPWLDAACIGLKLAVAGAVAAYVLAGCGGGILTLDAPDAADAGAGDASAPDSGDAQDARGGEQSLADAVGGDSQSTPEGGTDANSGGSDAVDEPEAAPACCLAPTAACSYPLESCPIPSENHGSFPTSFIVDGVPANSECATEPTPSQCLCDYTCACINPTFTCPSGTHQSCSSYPIQGLLIMCSS